MNGAVRSLETALDNSLLVDDIHDTLIDTCSIQLLQEADDSQGGTVRSVNSGATQTQIPCSINEGEDREIEIEGRIQRVKVYTIHLAIGCTIGVGTHRVVVQGKTLEIVTVSSPLSIEPCIWCEGVLVE